PQAKGTLQIGSIQVDWVGALNTNTPHTNKAVLYNSGCSKLIKQYDPKTGVRMARLDTDNVHTPKNPHAVDLVINTTDDGLLEVTDITPGGGTHFFDGVCILQFTKNSPAVNLH